MVSGPAAAFQSLEISFQSFEVFNSELRGLPNFRTLNVTNFSIAHSNPQQTPFNKRLRQNEEKAPTTPRNKKRSPHVHAWERNGPGKNQDPEKNEWFWDCIAEKHDPKMIVGPDNITQESS